MGSSGFTLVELLVVVVICTLIALMASNSVRLSLASLDRADVAEVQASLSLVAQLLRLAGPAVLLFGAGFWYLVELRQAGRLDRFRLGHFLLLALTYSLFFTVFAVLGAHEIDAWIAVTIAALVSYPLLVLHVATIVDLRFALVSAFPLALFTTGIAVNGVYGAELRGYVYLCMFCAVIAHLTISYPRFARSRDARLAALEQELANRVTSLLPPAAALRSAVAKTRALLALQDLVEHESLRDWVQQRLATARDVLAQHERLVSTNDAMRSATRRSERAAVRSLGQELAERLSTQLPQGHEALQEAASALMQHRTIDRPITQVVAACDHCIACGHACTPGTGYCPGCGVPRAEAKTCRRCASRLLLPHHLMRPIESDALVTHCQGCGERHAG